MLQHPGIQLMQNRTLAWWPHWIRTVPFQDSCWWSSRLFPPEVSCYSVWNRATWYNVTVCEMVMRYNVIVYEMVMWYNVIVSEMVMQYNVIVYEMVMWYNVIVSEIVMQFNAIQCVWNGDAIQCDSLWNGDVVQCDSVKQSLIYSAIVCETMR